MLANDVDEIQDDPSNSTAIVTPHPKPPHHKKQLSWDELIFQNLGRLLFSEMYEGVNLVSVVGCLIMLYFSFKILKWAYGQVQRYKLTQQAYAIQKSRKSLKFNYSLPQGVDSDLLLRMDVKDIR